MIPLLNLRYFVEISYHGGAYHGWQIQKNAHTVQAELQSALSQLFKQSVEITGSGRTDTGVHALQQYFHMDLPLELDASSVAHQLNAILPPDIAVLNLFSVPSEAHARFSAISRSYQYRIIRRKDPFLQDRCYFYHGSLDLDSMNEACVLMLNYEDFRCFSRVKTSVNNFLCNLTQAEWKVHNETQVFYVSANRFLRGMVRAMVGTLMEVGLNKMGVTEFQSILESGDRRRAGRSVPACGLFLTKVTYPRRLVPAKESIASGVRKD